MTRQEPGEGETLEQVLDRMITDITVGANGDWTEAEARQAIFQLVTSWYIKHERAGGVR